MTVNEALQNLSKNASAWWFWVQLSWTLYSCPLDFERWRCVRKVDTCQGDTVVEADAWKAEPLCKSSFLAHFSSCFSSALDSSLMLMTGDFQPVILLRQVSSSLLSGWCLSVFTDIGELYSSLLLLRWIPQIQSLRAKKLSLLLSLPRGAWNGGLDSVSYEVLPSTHLCSCNCVINSW